MKFSLEWNFFPTQAWPATENSVANKKKNTDSSAWQNRLETDFTGSVNGRTRFCNNRRNSVGTHTNFLRTKTTRNELMGDRNWLPETHFGCLEGTNDTSHIVCTPEKGKGHLAQWCLVTYLLTYQLTCWLTYIVTWFALLRLSAPSRAERSVVVFLLHLGISCSLSLHVHVVAAAFVSCSLIFRQSVLQSSILYRAARTASCWNRGVEWKGRRLMAVLLRQ